MSREKEMPQEHLVRKMRTTAALAGAVGLVASAQFARAAPQAWSGAGGGAWSAASNWTPNGAPVAGNDLTFQGTGGSTSVTNGNFTFGTIQGTSGNHTVTGTGSTQSAQAVQAFTGGYTITGGNW